MCKTAHAQSWNDAAHLIMSIQQPHGVQAVTPHKEEVQPVAGRNREAVTYDRLDCDTGLQVDIGT